MNIIPIKKIVQLVDQCFAADDYDDRQAILKKLSKYDDIVVTDALLAYLHHSNDKYRWFLAVTLSEYDNKKSKAALRILLRDKDVIIRVQAAESIGLLLDKSAVGHLIVALDDSSSLVRVEVCDSLGAMHAKRAEDALIFVFQNDRIALVRGYAALALSEIGSKKAISTIKSKMACERQGHARLRMALALYEMDLSEQLTEIYKYLKSKYYSLRCAAANSLCNNIRKQDIGEAVEKLLTAYRKERSVAVRDTIKRALIEHGVEEAKSFNVHDVYQ